MAETSDFFERLIQDEFILAPEVVTAYWTILHAYAEEKPSAKDTVKPIAELSTLAMQHYVGVASLAWIDKDLDPTLSQYSRNDCKATMKASKRKIS